MLHKKDLSKKLWIEAITTLCLLNKLLTRIFNKRTSFEGWFGTNQIYKIWNLWLCLRIFHNLWLYFTSPFLLYWVLFQQEYSPWYFWLILLSNSIHLQIQFLPGCNFGWHRKGNRWSPPQSCWRCANWSSCNYTWECKSWWMCDDSCQFPCVTRGPSSQVTLDELLTELCTCKLQCPPSYVF